MHIKDCQSFHLCPGDAARLSLRHLVQAAVYHRQRLQEHLQDAEQQHDTNRVAMVSAALLAAQVQCYLLTIFDQVVCYSKHGLAQDYKHLPGPEKTPGGLFADYFQQVGAAGYEVLYHQASFDELKRYLRKLQNHQPVPEDAEIVLLEMTYLLAEHVSKCCSGACHFCTYLLLSHSAHCSTMALQPLF